MERPCHSVVINGLLDLPARKATNVSYRTLSAPERHANSPNELGAPVRSNAEAIMGQFDNRAHWLATENITRFEQQLKTETDTCQRKLLEGLIVLEQVKLKAIYEAGH